MVHMRKLLMILPAVFAAFGAANAQLPAPSPVPVEVPANLPPAPVVPAAISMPAPVTAEAPQTQIQAPPMLTAPLQAAPTPTAPTQAAPVRPSPAQTPTPASLPAPALTAQTPVAPIPMAPTPSAMPAQMQIPAQAPAIAAPPPQPADSGYVIGSDDMIEVSVLGAPDFTTRARVRADGTIALPYLGSVNVTGHTALSLGQALASRLRAQGIYANPVMNVEIVSFASRYVILLGEVASPGLQPVDRAYRVSEIIARAGGLRETGADFVIVTRTNGTELKLPFEKLATGGEKDDPLIQPGDKIFVPKAQTYYIYGQITSPGVYPIRGNDMTLRKAIASGGGLTSMGSERRIKVFHEGREKKMTMDELVQPGDVIVVGERLF